jgi:hypothetical protein
MPPKKQKIADYVPSGPVQSKDRDELSVQGQGVIPGPQARGGMQIQGQVNKNRQASDSEAILVNRRTQNEANKAAEALREAAQAALRETQRAQRAQRAQREQRAREAAEAAEAKAAEAAQKTYHDLATKKLKSEPYNYLSDSQGFRDNLQTKTNVTVIKLFNQYLETVLVRVRSKDTTGHYGTTAKSGIEEYQHAGGHTITNHGLCSICESQSANELEHVLPFFVASAYAGLGNDSKSGTAHPKAPLLHSIYFYACQKCNGEKKNTLFLNVPTLRSPRWSINEELLSAYLSSRRIKAVEYTENSLKKQLDELVKNLNGEEETDFLKKKYPDISIVDHYLIEKGLTINRINPRIKKVLAHYLSGLEITAYYKCFNKYLNSESLRGKTDETQIMQILTTNINEQMCFSFLTEVNRIIDNFVRGAGPSGSRSHFGKRKQKPRLKSLKQLVSDLKSLKKF